MTKLMELNSYRNLITNFKSERIKLGSSQMLIANKFGKPQSFVSKYEMYERSLRVDEIVIISIILHLNFIEVMRIFCDKGR